MTTFEDALRALTDARSDIDHETLQQEFTPEIEDNEHAQMIATSVTSAMLQLFVDDRIDRDTLLRSLYLNGMALGVAIGVKMEKNDE